MLCRVDFLPDVRTRHGLMLNDQIALIGHGAQFVQEAIATFRYRLDELLAARVLPEDLPQHINGLRQIGLFDDCVGPDRSH